MSFVVENIFPIGKPFMNDKDGGNKGMRIPIVMGGVLLLGMLLFLFLKPYPTARILAPPIFPGIGRIRNRVNQ